MLIALSIVATVFAGLTAGLVGVAMFALGLAAGYALRWYTAS